jgi:hypothetical protein
MVVLSQHMKKDVILKRECLKKSPVCFSTYLFPSVNLPASLPGKNQDSIIGISSKISRHIPVLAKIG